VCAWKAIGQVHYGLTEAEKNSLIFRRSIYVANDILEGDLFSEENLRIVRPGDGAPPRLYEHLIGKKARRRYLKGEPLTLENIF
jgi:sialic acid synthase SpsE